MARYCTTGDVRLLLGLEQVDAPDTILEPLMDWAQQEILRHITIQVKGEQPTQSAEDSKRFWVSCKPIADTNFDKTVDKNDVSFWGWGDTEDEATKVALTVSAVYGDTGQIYLVSDPGDTYEAYSVDYHYYPCYIDWTLVPMATALLTAHLYVMREVALVPKNYALGPLRVVLDRPWQDYWKRFLQVLMEIKKRPYKAGKSEETTEPARTGLGSLGDTE